jgi:hypothetical protein
MRQISKRHRGEELKVHSSLSLMAVEIITKKGAYAPEFITVIM